MWGQKLTQTTLFTDGKTWVLVEKLWQVASLVVMKPHKTSVCNYFHPLGSAVISKNNCKSPSSWEREIHTRCILAVDLISFPFCRNMCSTYVLAIFLSYFLGCAGCYNSGITKPQKRKLLLIQICILSVFQIWPSWSFTLQSQKSKSSVGNLSQNVP